MECLRCHQVNPDDAAYCSACATRLAFDKRYAVTAILGSGTYGVVFKCKDKQLPRTVAIKELLQQHRQNEKLRRRVQDEAETLAVLQHDNIVRIIDTDPDELYIIMEYIPDAKDLGQVEKENPGYCVAHFDQLVEQLTSALEFAHSKGRIHRDLKYENILVSEGKFKISDFGLAAILHDETRSPSTSGTLPYTAPEILSREKIDTTVDLYALGVLFYHIWTGHFPFEGSDLEIARAHLEKTPLDPRKWNPRLSKELAEIILKLLAKDAIQRYPSARALRNAYYEGVGNKEVLTITHLDEFQSRLAGIFSEINKERDAYDLLTNIQIRASGLSRHSMAPPSDQSQKMQVIFLCRLFGWAFSMATERRVKARAATLSKYRNRCPYCSSAECQCPATGKTKSLESVTGDIPNFTSFDEIREMFRRIYGKRNTDLVTAVHKLHIELGELSEAVLKMQYNRNDLTERQVNDEVADIFAWLFAVANLMPESVDMSRELVKYYDHRCPVCSKDICKCDWLNPRPQLLPS